MREEDFDVLEIYEEHRLFFSLFVKCSVENINPKEELSYGFFGERLDGLFKS